MRSIKTIHIFAKTSSLFREKNFSFRKVLPIGCCHCSNRNQKLCFQFVVAQSISFELYTVDAFGETVYRITL